MCHHTDTEAAGQKQARMTTFDDEFAGLIHRSWSEPKSCWTDGHQGPWTEFGTAIDRDGTVLNVGRCNACKQLAECPAWIRDIGRQASELCAAGPLHYNHYTAESEAEYSARLITRLNRTGWRILAEEAWGRHPDSPKPLRCDYVVEPPTPEEWGDWADKRRVRFVIETKRHDANMSAALWQAVDYSLTTFDGFGRMPVLLTPRPWDHLSDTAKAFGRGRIGDIHLESKHWRWAGQAPERIPEQLQVWMSAHCLWDETEGTTYFGRTRKLMDQRFGSAR